MKSIKLLTAGASAITIAAAASLVAWSSGGGGDPGGSGANSVSITATRTAGTAPAGFIFEAEATSDEVAVEIPYHDVYYIWTFDDPTSTATYMTNSPMWGTSLNTHYGPVVTHTFRAAGTYTVEVTAIFPSGSTKTDTVEITIADPDSVFATADCAVISHDAGYTDGPSGVSVYTSFSAAQAALNSKSQQRYFFARGEDFWDWGNFTLATGSRTKVFLESCGTGELPIIKNVVLNTTISQEISVSGIEILGTFDNINIVPQYGSYAADGGLLRFTYRVIDTHKTFCDMKFTNSSGTAFDPNGGSAYKHTYLSNIYADGWKAFFCLSESAGYFGVEGSTIRMPTGTMNGPDGAGDQYGGGNKTNNGGTGPWFAWHTCFRFSTPSGPICFNNNDMNGWVDWSADTINRVFNPPIRWNASIAEAKLNIDRLRTEGAPFYPNNNTTNYKSVDVYAVVDGWYGVSSAHQGIFSFSHGGITYRNCLVIVPNTPSGSRGLQASGFISTDAEKNPLYNLVSRGGANRRNEVLNCTLVDLRNDANASNRGNGGPFLFYIPEPDNPGYWTTSNLLSYAPNRSVAVGRDVQFEPLDTSTPLFSSMYAGEYWDFTPLDTTRAYGDAPLCSYRPQAGSSAIGGATGKIPPWDLFRATRVNNTIGAVEAV